MTELLPDISVPTAGPEDTRTTLTAIFEAAINNAPRSRQKRIGPSELGIPCDRRLGYKLAGVEPCNNNNRLAWKPTIGTAVHGWAQETVEAANPRTPLYEMLGPRFLVEVRVDVGDEYDGHPLLGNCDIYDRVTATSLDYKVVGGEQLRKYKADGPGPQYRIQGHTYGRGWRRRGYPVRHVAVWFLPRDQEFNQNYLWHEPYDESLVTAALQRAAGIQEMVNHLGTGALPLLQTADAMCGFCPHFLPGSTEHEEACPGHPGAIGYLR